MTTLEQLTRAIEALVDERVAAKLADVIAHDPDEFLEHSRWPVSRRRACELARSGAIPAKRHGRVWLARRRDIDAWASAGESCRRIPSRKRPGLPRSPSPRWR